MRPPITSTTLQQQNEGSRQQLQQQQHQQFQIKTSELQPQQQHQQQTQQLQIARKTKLSPHEVLVEKHLNSACSAQVTHTQPISIARKSATPASKAPTTAPLPSQTYQANNSEFSDFEIQKRIQDSKLKGNRLYNHKSDEEADEAPREQRYSLHARHSDIDDDDDDEEEFTAQLVDLSISPPSPPLLTAPTAALIRPHQAAAFKDTSTKRSSIISDCQYSTQSSASSDDVSLNLNSNLEGYPLQPTPLQPSTLSRQTHTRANSFDDAAEHFIINFPGDSFLTQNDCIINLPLSETEPLLTNIEATVADKQRSICLNKNSASLIFTKKELPQRAASVNERRFFTPFSTSTNTTTTNNNQQITTNKHSRNNTNTNSTRRCHSLRSTTTPSSVALTQQSTTNRRPTKHLPATYHQQQRRSLQLNYNNNLVTTSTCSANNNNHCCPATKANIKGSNSGGAVANTTSLHRHLHTRHSYSQQHGGNTSTLTSSPASGLNEIRNTATATRKQHAYSWYAPVYSALEEELEQDSRDSSPIRSNLANTKKHLTTTHYPHRSSQKHSTTSSSDNETVALLETRNQINIQAQLHAQGQQSTKNGGVSGAGGGSGGGGGISIGEGLPAAQRKGNASAQALTLQLNSISGATGQATQNYETEGPHAGSLGLAGGPLPRRKRLENLEKFFKSLVGLRPSPNSNAATTTTATASAGNTVANLRNNCSGVENSPNPLPLPSSPEIRITRTPSDQNVDKSDAERQLLRRSQDKLAVQSCYSTQGSTSSLNVVQQKLWNIVRRDGSAASLYQDKSQSLVQYSGMRKCETVLALTSRQGNRPHSPVQNGCLSPHQHYMGSGVFSASGVEQIRPLNRLRNSTASINNGATCSRCSSLLSLAASGSRYSLNVAANGFVPSSASHQLLAPIPATPPTFHVGPRQQQQQQQNPQRRYTASGMVRRFSFGSRRSRSVSSSSRDGESTTIETNVPQRKISTCSCTSSTSGVSCSRKSSAGAQSTTTNSSISPPSNQTTATLNSSLTPSSVSTALATATSLSSTPASPTITASLQPPAPPPPTVNNNSTTTNSTINLPVKHSPSSAQLLCVPPTTPELLSDSVDGLAEQPASTPACPFQMFTCKLCLIDVETVKEATTLIQCGCQFCTECMKAYIEFEISEGAYEISCPDAQCPAQGVITLPEIANLTTANLMKKHHRYRLNREIELDKTRTWCPRAGCETVCRVGGGGGLPELLHGDGAAPSTSTAAGTTPTSPLNANGNNDDGHNGQQQQQLRCSVVCPSCKDEFCSACKKTWHPNMTCEENSRRLVADGQDDIGIPFDNDLIKCCPMCAVPIEKDEGCAQMMCKRCKHVFCWYCLASLDDDFLLRHYDKGPCKNKLGHSRASVVWHRAQVIGIFAGFGILLLVASPLLLLAAPCIICCKCRSCSSKIDEGDAEMEEATQLQSF